MLTAETEDFLEVVQMRGQITATAMSNSVEERTAGTLLASSTTAGSPGMAAAEK